AEIIIYKDSSGRVKEKEVEQYVPYKYSPPVDLGEDINISYGFADTTISAYKSWFTSYKWTFGGDSINADSAISVSSDGTYTVTVTDIFGYSSEASIKVFYPNINYPTNVTDTAFCLGDTLFWNTGFNSDYQYQWLGSALDTSILAISQAGKYAVKVIDSLGNFHLSDTLTITIDSFPVQNSLGSDRNVCEGEAIGLVSEGDNILFYNWNTGSNNPYINIDTAGTYTLTVTSSKNCVVGDTVVLGISGLAPTAMFTADTICFNDSTSFTNLSSIGGGYSIDSVRWNFGDGQESLIFSPKHLFTSADTFVINLTAYSGNCSSFFTDSVVVRYRPQSNFIVQYGLNQCTGSLVNFIDTSNSLIPITSYSWNFGTGDTSSDKNPNYSFTNNGTYSVQQNITSNNGCIDSTYQSLIISDNLPLTELSNLINPKNNATATADDSILFEWGNSANAINYLFEIAKDTAFALSYYSETTDSLFVNYKPSSSGIWYWKVSAFNLCQVPTTTKTQTLNLVDLQQNGELVLWFNAYSINLSDSQKVEQWSDDSPEGFNASQTTELYKPTFIQNDLNINNQAQLSFDQSYLSIGDHLNIDSIRTFFIVAKQKTFSNYPWFVSKGYNTNGSFAFGTEANTSNLKVYADSYLKSSNIFADTNWALYTVSINKDSIHFYNGNKNSWVGLHGQDLIGQNNYEFLIGSSQAFTSYLDGNIAEIIIYKDSIGRVKEKEVEQYLRYKYSPPVDLGEDINISYGFADTTISAYKPWFTTYGWSTESIDSAITVSNDGSYTITVTDIFGFQSSDSIKVDFQVKPQQISNTTICLYDTLTWNPNLSGPYDYQYSCPEGSGRAYATTPILNITKPGNYWLTITDTNGYSWYSDTISIQVNNFPAKVSLDPDTTLCQFNRIYLKSGFEQATQYSWSTGSTEDYIILETAGTYSVTVSDSMGCVGMDSATFAIEGIAPTPDFSYTNHCLGDETAFTDASSSPDGSTINSWLWDFGNNEGSENSNSKIQYSKSGTYTVVLTIGSDNNCSNSIKKNVAIYQKPVAAFGPSVVCSNIQTELGDKSKTVDGDVSKWLWSFPDGSVSEEQHAHFNFTKTGKNSVQLIAQSNFGCLDTAIQIIEVKEGPKADFSYSAGCLGYPMYFTDESESFLGSSLSYLWSFEEGKNSTQNNPSYTYSDTGIFEVVLVLKQALNNCTSTISKSIRINENPSAAITKDEFCEGVLGKLYDVSTSPIGNIASRKWTIEEKGIFKDSEIALLFDSAGVYKTQLLIINEMGCSDYLSDSVNVHPIPQAYFLTNIQKGPIPLSVVFDNQTSGALEYEWNFGDGSISNEAFPTHTYADSGIFAISLLATSDRGCINSAYGSVKAIIPRVDLALNEVYAEVQNGFLKVSALIQNHGTLDLDNVELFYKANYGQKIKEVLTEKILSGQTKLHQFTTQMQVKSNVDLTHICATVLPSGEADELPEDNEACMAFESAFKAMHPYPNPVKDKLVMEFIVPFDAQVKIHLFNQFGELTHKVYEGLATEGFNRQLFDVSTLSKGTYYYWIEYEGNVRSYQIVIQ
ncbi:MAG: PKD domain-containing protein, partial [Salinivirgaceae bacterium]|nr:PKD domain-containing protein [Salinivirgaceae bacterium]